MSFLIKAFKAIFCQQQKLSLRMTGNTEADFDSPTIAEYDYMVNTETPETLIAGACAVVKFARPEWDQSEIKCKIMTGGTTNTLLRCDHPPTNEKVLIRIYGQKTELFIDRRAEVRNMMLLEEHGLAPKVYCAFSNGLCYGFFEGQVLDIDLMKEADTTLMIARHMARMHNVPINPKAQAKIVPMLEHYLSLVPDKIRQSAESDLALEFNLDHVSLKDEIQKFKELALNSTNPVVFCHNDLLSKNILRNDDEIYFIDYEYASANFQAFDIGNFFCEFGGQENYDRSRYPGRDFQLPWIKCYLQEFKALRNEKGQVTDEDVEKLYTEVNQFSLSSSLLWGLWALIQTAHSTIEFDFRCFALERLGMYFAKRDEFLAL